MSIFFLLAVPAVIVCMLLMPLVPVYRGITTGKAVRKSVIFNLCAFFGVMALAVILPVGDLITYAAGEAAEAGGIIAGMTTGSGLAYIAAAIATGMSSIAAGIAVASAAPAAIGATSEDPKSFGKALIFVALGEGCAIYGLLISILIINNL